MSNTVYDPNSLQIHFLDMGNEKYGDSVLCQMGARTILIDGGHLSDLKGSGGTDSIPKQLGDLLGGTPCRVNLLVVTHCPR